MIQEMAITGASVLEPMRTTKKVISWDEILICGAQLATLPLNETETVSTRTVIGPERRRSAGHRHPGLRQPHVLRRPVPRGQDRPRPRQRRRRHRHVLR